MAVIFFVQKYDVIMTIIFQVPFTKYKIVNVTVASSVHLLTTYQALGGIMVCGTAVFPMAPAVRKVICLGIKEINLL